MPTITLNIDRKLITKINKELQNHRASGAQDSVCHELSSHIVDSLKNKEKHINLNSNTGNESEEVKLPGSGIFDKLLDFVSK